MAEINPLDWLAIAMATRAKEEKERIPTQEAYERGLVGERITKYGGRPEDFDIEWERTYKPQAAASQAQAQQMYDYWMGLPAALVGAAREGRSVSSGSATKAQPSSPTFNYTQMLTSMYGPDVFARGTTPFFYGGPTQSRSESVDTAEARARTQARIASGVKAKQLTRPPSRVVRFS